MAEEKRASMESLFLHVMADSRISIKGSGFQLSVEPHFPISIFPFPLFMVIVV